MDTELARLVFNQTVEKYHCALGEVNTGSIQAFLDLFSKEDDISLANPAGAAVQGYKQVMDSAQSTFPKLSQAESVSFENLVTFVNCDFGYIVENEQYKAKVGSQPDLDRLTLRATTIFRLESGGWKVVHRHADPIASKQLVETMS
ncbi:MAG TPA: nuclear transport factor 2 family protein [Anaerolineales bacterium]|nr:nuclear transport factor 2 family protein [Anaerolineales bacterium]